ncbi:Bug family tripartite tricarboxylate transporter substrate binding protein [Pigmentiphaga kullae]|uniref:Tripartite-type tricarboxylate transporter receptor subunit TctC n=1 Tax=Pigmentiphaga kullae TaxID=151784 RepID=A0A4Q7N911_9BURK|nr:tripartite tricarboxylate transporter substrate binding protein [Pigmentiphaga kullae]RZS78595.1 tripartite-type tricarboxylate transporter receptor subunit TctC [Pigmentiphaga kullae]
MYRPLRRLGLAACLWACAMGAATAADADYPSRAVRMVVPYVVGGSTDLLGRQLAQRLGAALGQQVFVENQGGAGSTIGTATVARAQPDGYTIGLLDTAFAINPSLYANLPYDSLKDFDFLSVVATATGVLVVNSKRLKARTVQELVAEAKARPDQLSFASAGAGTVVHLHGETFKTAAGIKLLHVPYKGAGPAIADLLGGQVDMMFNLPALVVQQVKSGVLAPIAVTGDKRSPLFPDTPSFAEAGYPGVDAVSLWVVAAPKGLPAAVHDKLVAAIGQAMAGPDMQAKLAESSFERTLVPYPRSVDFVREQMAKFAAAVKASGATVN